MIKLLRFIPQKYHVFVIEYGYPCAGAVIFFTFVVIFIAMNNPSLSKIERHMMVEVLSFQEVPSKKHVTYTAIIQLPSGDTSTVKAVGFLQIEMIRAPVCVAEVRNDKGRVWHELSQPNNCFD